MLERFLTDNPAIDGFLALGITALVLAGAWFMSRYGLRRLRAATSRTTTPIDDLIADALQSTYVILFLPVALYLGTQVLTVPSRVENFLSHAAVTALLLQAALWVNRLIVGWLRFSLRTRAAQDPAGVSALNILGYVARLALWVFVLLLALDNFGFNITTLLAGLGIGGVAVALAAQNVLGDLFASLSIVFDRPFVIGDFIVVGDQLGTVEYIGLKTTRIRSLSGEQVVFANSDLLKSRIHNYKRMTERRVEFRFGVVYQTAPDVLETIPDSIKEIVDSTAGTRFDRAHFKGFGDSSLDFEVVYYVLDSDYNRYMDIHQSILFRVFREFATRHVDFAYPTRTIHLESAATTT